MLRFCCTLAPEHRHWIFILGSVPEQHHACWFAQSVESSFRTSQSLRKETCLMTMEVCCSGNAFAKTEAGEAQPSAATELERTVEQPAPDLLCQSRHGTRRPTSDSTRTRAARACGTACDCRQRPAQGASSENPLFMAAVLQLVVYITGKADGRKRLVQILDSDQGLRHIRTLTKNHVLPAWKGPFVTRPRCLGIWYFRAPRSQQLVDDAGPCSLSKRRSELYFNLLITLRSV